MKVKRSIRPHYHSWVNVSNTFYGIHSSVKNRSNAPMNATEIRRQRLRELLSERFADNASDLARAVKKQQSYISELLKGKRSFGERVARDIERKVGVTPGWLDYRPQRLCALTGYGEGSIAHPSSDSQSGGQHQQQAARPLTADEQALLDAYRLLEPADREGLVAPLLEKAAFIRRYLVKAQTQPQSSPDQPAPFVTSKE